MNMEVKLNTLSNTSAVQEKARMIKFAYKLVEASYDQSTNSKKANIFLQSYGDILFKSAVEVFSEYNSEMFKKGLPKPFHCEVTCYSEKNYSDYKPYGQFFEYGVCAALYCDTIMDNVKNQKYKVSNAFRGMFTQDIEEDEFYQFVSYVFIHEIVHYMQTQTAIWNNFQQDLERKWKYRFHEIDAEFISAIAMIKTFRPELYSREDIVDLKKYKKIVDKLYSLDNESFIDSCIRMDAEEIYMSLVSLYEMEDMEDTSIYYQLEIYGDYYPDIPKNFQVYGETSQNRALGKSEILMGGQP